jgi:hypothetical protein
MGEMITELKKTGHFGYKSKTGIYASHQYFTGDFEDELSKLTFYDVPLGPKEVEEIDQVKGQQSGYKTCAFKSVDGKASTHNTTGEFWQEEDPKNYQYTDAYYQSPQIASMLDWFKCDFLRVRIFQQQPGHMNPTHTDFDNAKGTKFGETLRIFVQLDENKGDFNYRFQTEDSDVSIQLQQGQFLIFNPDYTAHGTFNSGDRVRNTMLMVVKKNDWLMKVMEDDTPKPALIDLRKLAEQRKVA